MSFMNLSTELEFLTVFRLGTSLWLSASSKSYSFSENELKQYFHYPKYWKDCLGHQTLFGVQTAADLPIWHTDVQSFSVPAPQENFLPIF
jgi:Zn-dependent oligopeptidase